MGIKFKGLTAKEYYEQQQKNSKVISVGVIIKLMNNYAQYYHAVKISKPGSVILNVKSNVHSRTDKFKKN